MEVTTNQSQLVSLGGFITSEIPVDDMGNAWIVSSQNDEFLITYIDPESEKAPHSLLFMDYTIPVNGKSNICSARIYQFC